MELTITTTELSSGSAGVLFIMPKAFFGFTVRVCEKNNLGNLHGKVNGHEDLSKFVNFQHDVGVGKVRVDVNSHPDSSQNEGVAA